MEDNLRDANEDGERKARFVLVVHLAKDSHLGDERRMPNVVTLVKVFGSFSTTADFYFYFFFSSLSAASPHPAGTGRFSQSHFSYRVNLAAKKLKKNLSFSLPFNTLHSRPMLTLPALPDLVAVITGCKLQTLAGTFLSAMSHLILHFR